MGAGVVGAPWSVERRFRVTEVFLAVLWVWMLFLGDVSSVGNAWFGYMLIRGSVVRAHTSHGCSRIV
jgi:hypothetical protein